MTSRLQTTVAYNGVQKQKAEQKAEAKSREYRIKIT